MPLKFWGKVGWRTSGSSCLCPPGWKGTAVPSSHFLALFYSLHRKFQTKSGSVISPVWTDKGGCKDSWHKHRKLLKF